MRSANEIAQPNQLVLQVSPGAALPAHHPAANKTQIDGQATAYVCFGRTCQLPVTDPVGLGGMLEQSI